MNRCASLIVAVVIVAAACATMGPKTTSIYQPVFDFTPPSTASPGAAGVTLALVDPQYPGEVLWQQLWPDLPTKMAADFEELLTARGFTLKGPFPSYDQMVYSDKKDSDLVVTPDLAIDAAVVDFTVEEKIYLIGPNKFAIKTGTARLGGRVTLSASESLTDTKLWVKSVDVPHRTVTFQGELVYDEPPTHVSLAEPGLRSALGQALEEVYARTLQASWEYIDPEEMQAKKNEADEIKKKAGFEVSR